MTDLPDYVLACVNPPSIWNLFPSLETAAAAAEEANTYNVKLEAHGAPKRDYEPMTYADYKARERAFYLSDPEHPITPEKFTEMLEVLPPEKWENHGDFETFLMSERWSGPYTHQYARRGRGEDAKYWQKMVDASDRSTWMQRTR